MAKYIDSEKAIDACFNGWNNNAHDCAENIRSIPAADVVERKRGKWREDMWLTTEGYSCSECNCFTQNPSMFCPDCGADMREES